MWCREDKMNTHKMGKRQCGEHLVHRPPRDPGVTRGHMEQRKLVDTLSVFKSTRSKSLQVRTQRPPRAVIGSCPLSLASSP